MAKKNVKSSSSLQQIVNLLEGEEPGERHKILRAVRSYFEGEEEGGPAESGPGGKKLPSETLSSANPNAFTAWARRHSITQDQLDEVFETHAGKTSVIADTLPGDSDRANTISCYLLEGLRAFLETGAPSVTESGAIALCKQLGCFNKTNHGTYRKAVGKSLGGDKKAGWRLTAPGLKAGAALVKEMTQQGGAE